MVGAVAYPLGALEVIAIKDYHYSTMTLTDLERLQQGLKNGKPIQFHEKSVQLLIEIGGEEGDPLVAAKYLTVLLEYHPEVLSLAVGIHQFAERTLASGVTQPLIEELLDKVRVYLEGQRIYQARWSNWGALHVLDGTA